MQTERAQNVGKALGNLINEGVPPDEAIARLRKSNAIQSDEQAQALLREVLRAMMQAPE